MKFPNKLRYCFFVQAVSIRKPTQTTNNLLTCAPMVFFHLGGNNKLWRFDFISFLFHFIFIYRYFIDLRQLEVRSIGLDRGKHLSNNPDIKVNNKSSKLAKTQTWNRSSRCKINDLHQFRECIQSSAPWLSAYLKKYLCKKRHFLDTFRYMINW